VTTIRALVPAHGIKRDFGLIAVAEAQAAAGLAEDAVKTVKEVADAEWREGGLWQLVKGHASRGSIDAARRTADAIEDGRVKGEALKEIVVALIRAKDLAAAAKTASQIGHDIDRCDALTDVAKAQAAAGQKAEAEKTLRIVFALADRLENGPRMKGVREGALSNWVAARAATGDVDGALDRTTKQEDVHIRAMARIRVAEALAGKARK
jgi:hypothetical protein